MLHVHALMTCLEISNFTNCVTWAMALHCHLHVTRLSLSKLTLKSSKIASLDSQVDNGLSQKTIWRMKYLANIFMFNRTSGNKWIHASEFSVKFCLTHKF